ncbi:MAG: DUF3500 domain-containing protein [Verrucomicrobiota bacterium]
MNRKEISRRRFFHLAAGTALSSSVAAATAPPSAPRTGDALPLQLYRSLSEAQRDSLCLPLQHESRYQIANWWYIHQEHRINRGFSPDQLDLIQQIFDSYHHPDFREAVNRQVTLDQYNNPKYAPSVGFFGAPEDKDFEFLFTGHHVTRRGNAHTDTGIGFGNAPIFYGHHAPGQFHETADHPGNPYWYQGLIFNEFVQTLDGEQQKKALAAGRPRSEKPDRVIAPRAGNWPGLACRDLSPDQQESLLETMGKTLVMFRPGDVSATLTEIRDRNLIEDLYVSYYGGKHDIGNDGVWDTWQIEGPNLIWYFRGEPHIHAYFHLRST